MTLSKNKHKEKQSLYKHSHKTQCEQQAHKQNVLLSIFYGNKQQTCGYTGKQTEGICIFVL